MKVTASVKMIIGILLSIVVLWGCSDTFLVTKDGKSYFFGGKRDELYRMLCDSGDLGKILNGTRLSQEIKDGLYRYNCTQRSGEKVKEIYASLKPEQRRELRLSFQNQGYDINLLAC
ncbi:MAG: hypothetical protein M1147_11285 [Nitrospirae bacterium]|nr:hypothetical protein [Nitrospirota bacterium]MCL5978673.1 hypothetical protein [Nitrospirota bacterium]